MVISPRSWLTQSMAEEKRQRDRQARRMGSWIKMPSRWAKHTPHFILSLWSHYLAQCPRHKAAISSLLSNTHTVPNESQSSRGKLAEALCSALRAISVQQLQDRYHTDNKNFQSSKRTCIFSKAVEERIIPLLLLVVIWGQQKEQCGAIFLFVL